jgi:hypothetical protein
MGLFGGGGGGGGLFGGIGSIFSGVTGLFGLFGLASGTSSTPRGPILVGERGPEIIHQQGGLGVVPAGQTRAFLRGVPGFAGGIGAPIIPANLSAGLQNMVARGGANDNGGSAGGDTHNYAIHVHAIDSRSGAQFLMSHSDAIAASLHRAKRNFNSMA